MSRFIGVLMLVALFGVTESGCDPNPPFVFPDGSTMDGAIDAGAARDAGTDAGGLCGPGQMVLHYAFEEAAGSTTLVDMSGCGHDGTTAATLGATGQDGSGAIDFGGGTTLLASGTLDLSEEVTIAMWINPRSHDDKCLFTLQRGGATVSAAYSSLPGGGGPAIYLPTNPAMCRAEIRAFASFTVVPPLDEWTHLAFTVNITGVVRRYIDGVEMGTSGAGSQRFCAGELTLLIGTDPEVSPLPDFDGLMDELRVYRRALTDAEICALAGCTP